MAPKAVSGRRAGRRRADLGVVGSLHGAHARRGLHDLHEGVIGIVGGVEVAQVVGWGAAPSRRRA